MKKRLLSLLLALTLICTLLVFPASAADVVDKGEFQNFIWTLTSDGTLTISGKGTLTSFLKDSWAEWSNMVKTVVIEPGVTEIWSNAFSDCSNIESVLIPDGVTKIKESVFSNCTRLMNITIPSSVTDIDKTAFFNCIRLTDINVAESNMNFCSIQGVLLNKYATRLICCPGGKIGDYTIPDSALIISECAFQNCVALTSITIPSGVTNIGEYAFEGCEKLRNVYYNGDSTQWNNISIGEYNFPLFFAEKHFKDDLPSPEPLEPPLRIYTEIPNTRADLFWLMWRIAGAPDYSEANCSFSDVSKNDYYYSAVIWATEHRITAGTSERTFSPDDHCTRGQIVSFIWRFYGMPKPESTCMFQDVGKGDFFYDAVCWFSEQKQFGEYTATHFDPYSSDLSISYNPNNGGWTIHMASPFLYSVNDGMATLVKHNQTLSDKPNVVIPEMRGICPVTAIAASAFADQKLAAVTIPKSVTIIENSAFSGCSNLQDVYYGGNEDQWEAISVGSFNEALTNATVHFDASTSTEIKSNPSDVTILAGQPATFSVVATGDIASWQWQVKTTSGNWKSSTAPGCTTDTMRTTATAARNGYQYRCIVTDADGNTVISAPATLTVAAPAAITGSPMDCVGKAGQIASFAVSAEGEGLTYQWQLSDDGGETWKNSSVKSAIYSTKMTEGRNGRMVRCVVTDQFGNSAISDAAVMRIKNPLVITKLPQNYVGKVNSTASFFVTAQGSGLSYQWQYSDNGTKWSNSSVKSAVYSTKLTDSRDGRMVRCIVTDQFGNSVTSAPASMKIG